MTLSVACRTTRQAPEKRQRVLLSPRYDEAVQDVNRQLGDVKQMLQELMVGRDTAPDPTATASTSTHHISQPMIDAQVPSLSSVHDGFNGDSSFQSHAHQVETALEATLAASELLGVEASATSSPNQATELLGETDTADTPGRDGVASEPLPQPLDPEPGSLLLPPLTTVLKLLRMAKTHKQRFFVDVPFIREDEFIDLCRGVYFATEPVSLWTWICVNVGLYYLFFQMTETDCSRVASTLEAVRSHSRMLKANTEAAMQTLRLCSEPSIESCRALALLVSVPGGLWTMECC